jgi:hypothetical protein
MPRSKSVAVVACLLLSICAASRVGAQNPKYTDPQAADEDFAIQGEYSGTLQTKDGEEKFGVQVVAQGKGEFIVVGYHGGLPGDGWNGEDPVRIEQTPDADGKLVPLKAKDGVLKVADKHGSGVIEKGVMTCTLAGSDKPSGALKRVERKSPTLGAKPPEGAIVLFDGTSADEWKGGRLSDDGLLMEGVTSNRTFGDHTLHIEFRLPYQPLDRGQARGNSGLYLQGRYEVQMLDSFGLLGKNNECGGLYEVKDPDLNMCLPPLAWQTYDIDFTAAKYDGDKVVAPPRITVRHNGVVIHDNVELSATQGTRASPVKPGPEPGPLYLQNHGNPVRYRNIWVVER